MASPGAIFSGRGGKAPSRITSLLEKIEALEAAQRGTPQQMAQTVEDIREAASRQRPAPPAPAVLSPDEMTPDGPAVPPPIGPFMPPPGGDFAARVQAVGPRPEVLDALRAKARRYQADLAAGRPAVPLSIDESLALVSAGDDPADVLGRQLTKREYDQIMRNVVKGVPISPEAASALRRSPAGDVIEQNWQGTLTPDQQDALEASDFDLEYGGQNNLTPKQARANPAMQVADAVRQYTTPAAMESVSVEGVKRLAETIQQDYPAGSRQRAALEQAFAGWSPNPDAPDLPPPDYAVRAMEEGRRRLAALEQMASDPNFTQEAVSGAAIQRAAQSRAGGSGPRPGESFAPTEPGLPAAVSRFNELPLDVRQDIVRRLGAESPARRLVAMEGGEVSIAPNAVAAMLRPANDVSDLIEQMDAAKRVGDQSTVDAVSELVRQAPEADRRAAIAQFRERTAIEAELRQALGSVSPTPAAIASPGPTALRPQGAMTPEFVVAPPDRMPGAFEEAEAAFNQSAPQRESQRPRTFVRNRDDRLAAIGRVLGEPDEGEKSLGRKDGMFFKGGGKRLERRADYDRMVDSNDTKAIRSAREAEGEWQARMAEFNAAHQQALADAQAASGAAELAAAMQRVDASDAVRREWARQGPSPKYVNKRGDEVRASTLVAEYRKNFPDANERSIRKMIADDGWDEQAIGRSAWPDAKLSKAASAPTMDGIVGALLEHKPKPQSNLNRSSDMLSPGDVASQNDEARDLLRGQIEESDLPVELDTTEDVADRARRGRLGGGSAASRREAALQGNSTGGLFGSYNPLELQLGKNNNLYASARELAADVLEETDSYHSRTPNYETNLERLTELLEDVYGPNSRNEGLLLPDPLRQDPLRQQRRALLTGEFPEGMTETDPAGALRAPMTQEPDQVPTRIMKPEGHPAYELENRRDTASPLSPEEETARFAQEMDAYERARRAPGYTATAPAQTLSPRAGIPVTIDSSGQPLAGRPAAPKARKDFSQPETVLTPEQLADLAQNENAVPPAQLNKAVGTLSARRRQAAAEQAQRQLPKPAGGLPPARGDSPVNADLDAAATSVDQSVEDKLNASDPLAGRVGGEPIKSVEEIEAEVLDELQDRVQQHYDSMTDEGLTDNDKWRKAQELGGTWYRAERVRRLYQAELARQAAAGSTPNTASPKAAPAQPSPSAARAGGDTTPTDAPGTAAATGSDVGDTPAAAGGADTKSGAAPDAGIDPQPPRQADGTVEAIPDPAQQQTPRTWGQWLRKNAIGAAALTGAGTVGLWSMQKPSGPAPIDIPSNPPLPVGLPVGLTSGSSAAGGADVDEAAAIERTLERLRGGRSSSTQSAPYHTMQNYNMWR
jgi:hypothetical protein